jgi:CRP-like cAMP-binding protein
MDRPNTKTGYNRFLGSLSASDQELIEPHLKPMKFKVHQTLEGPDAQIDNIYFPSSGLASVVAKRNGEETEVGMIGWEGLTGLAAIFGAERTPNRTYIQIAGEGRSISAKAFLEAMSASPSLAKQIGRFAHSFAVQLSHTALANARGSLEQRLCRWLLMCHDRCEGDDLPITHEFLSIMLGVRRAGVTTALQEAEKRGLIAAKRSCITVIDRHGIEACANGLYGPPEEEYERLFSPRAKQS